MDPKYLKMIMLVYKYHIIYDDDFFLKLQQKATSEVGIKVYCGMVSLEMTRQIFFRSSSL